MTRLRLATRASALALAQSATVVVALKARHPGLDIEVLTFKSDGDQRRDIALSAVGGQGLFTKVLEDALLRGDADFAVHSLKDLPTGLPEGLGLAAIGVREDWRDAWLSHLHASPGVLPGGSTVGTGSPRRRAQLERLRPGLRFDELRGNVETRLKKISLGEVDGGVLALAGLKRLGLEAHVRHLFGEDEMLPAPGQGFIAIEAATGTGAFELCRAFNDVSAEAEASCERAFLGRLQAGCTAPVGALARVEGRNMTLKVFVGFAPGRPQLRSARGDFSGARDLGVSLADDLLAAGA